MTGLLKDLMHDRADGLEPPVLDLEAITRNGDRRVRRRRGVAGVVGLVAVIGLDAATPQLLDLRDEGERGDVAVGEARPLTWSSGSVIHAGTKTVDVGHPIRAFVETGDGYVFSDPDGNIWSWTGSAAEKVGSIPLSSPQVELYGPDLAADGRVAAWLDETSPRVRFSWFDQSTGATGSYTAPAAASVEGKGPQVFSVADGTAYVFDGARTVALDLATAEGAPRTLSDSRLEIHDAVAGRYLVTHLDAEDQEHTTLTQDPAQPGQALGVRGGDLSPSGRYVMSENSATQSDTFTLIEVDTGKNLTPAITEDYGFFLGYTWTDDDTYTAFGMRGIGQGTELENDVEVDLLVCEVVDATCTKAENGPDGLAFQIPVGQNIGE